MKYLYVLKLQHEKYYVGTTLRKEERVLDHFTNNGSAFTRKYKPLAVELMIESNNDFDEDMYTKKYMMQFGINSVRGGSYCQVVLLQYQVQALEAEFNTIRNACFRCGRTSHYVNRCYAKTHCDGRNLDESTCEDESKDGYLVSTLKSVYRTFRSMIPDDVQFS